MANTQLTRLTLAEAADAIRRHALSPVELTQAVLERIAALDQRLNAFTTLVPADDALAAARVAEREIRSGRHRGPLHGIPVSVKDLIDTAGLRTTYGSGMFREHVPAADGAMPARLRELGAVLTGKTATHELGAGLTTNNFFFGPTLNPWDRRRSPGGSSGGAGAAAAAGLGPLHVGTDGGGSIRFPATWCGVVGHKPTIGLLSNRGQFGNGNTSFSVPGPLVRTVRDAAIASQALAGFDPEYVYSSPRPVPDLLGSLDHGVDGLRVGVSDALLDPAPDAPVRAAYDATLRRLEGLGATLVEVDLPSAETILRGVGAMFGIEGEVHLQGLIGDRTPVFGPTLAEARAVQGAPDVTMHVRSLHERQRIRRDYARAFGVVDVLVAPVAPCTAALLDLPELPLNIRCVGYTGAANLVGFPAVALPAGLADGLPLGVQVMADVGGDTLALRVAHALEQAAPEHRVQTPPLDV